MSFDDSRAGGGASDQFDARSHQGHLLIVKVFDEISPVITPYCKTGYKEVNGKVYANNAVRCAIVDMDEQGEDGLPGKIYPTVTIFTGLLVAELKKDVGRKILVMWRQKDPNEKSSPYLVMEMKPNANALAAGEDFLNRHPEFDQLPPPPPYVFQPPQQGPQPPSSQPTLQGGGQQNNWGQHNNWGNADPWAQAQPQGNGSFMDQAQSTNHWGQPQDSEAPF